ncbi:MULTISPECIES: iron-sulfur cluster biosynthesis family protein [Paenibacillus]|jgi:uncharacterized protein YqkB|uniref:Core domain-containing protein n=1 Tax=Paenibacillus baimaensis TaxID=2982185 RepID=A0ABT2UWD3_9BACL|nr:MULTISPECIES: iron-sulfur cluster biosynthesis family protein [unclassified Paenibacillus]MCU6798102.1 hypothetical protein [Paenibacillus sp. WQ 127069]OMF19857.1 hypothetical protein BK127_02825 [Paenibacillus sp. FSL H7-0331]
MHITFTDEAVQQITHQLPAGSGELKLVFDSEGCGCSANGVPSLWIVDKPEENDLRAGGSPFELWYEKKQEVYFEDNMTLDYRSANRSYILKSNGQIYNSLMQLIDKREQAN